MKKVTVFALIITFGIIAVHQLATAGSGRGGGWGCDGGPGYGYNRQAPDRKAQQAWENFYNDTAELRDQLYAKRSEYYDAVNRENVDKELAARLWGEIFDIQTQIHEHAATAGIKPGSGRGGYPCYGPNIEEQPSTEPSSSSLRS